MTIIAAILHLGNIQFDAGLENAALSNSKSTKEAIKNAAKLLKIKESAIIHAMTKRTIRAGVQDVETDLKLDQAEYRGLG